MIRGRARQASATRWAAIGAVSAGVVGGIVGLIVGLGVHPATAWFAVFELGIPASMLGAIVGLASGLVAHAFARIDLEERPADPESGT